ncbi:energy-coupling factor transporter transmembrane component T family protein [Sporolactobacillus vineae]|uniref:energy-coupling factor transporter transmembrane component T family protein n=1 Tax=Sporolactobacillus vineae TaxID=444463 RepID=UPI00028999BC|nr:energy-coupling factor transporter transmembrane component T [Sporolactobacillus vineae]
MKEHLILPDWLTGTDPETGGTGKALFIEKNISGFVRMLAVLREQRDHGGFLSRIQPWIKLPVAIMLIFLVSLSRSAAFVSVAAVGLLVLISVLPAVQLKRIISLGAAAAVFMAVTLLPAVFLGNPLRLDLVAKVWLSVSAAGLVAMSTSWPEMTEALKIFHVPDLFLFVLDITIKYLVILGNFVLTLFYALKVRTVGHISRKARSVGGIAGTLFLKSSDMAADLHDAMVCRGFSGHYRRAAVPAFHAADLLCLVVAGLLAAAFLFLN